MSDAKCKICRRAGEKLFLKGDRCFTPKCAMVHHPTPPGIHGGKRRGKRASSEFGNELREKQKVRFTYGLTEQELKNYVEKAGGRKGALLTSTIVELLERRLDNVVFRSGLAVSRSIARHLVSYRHITVNGKSVSSPSYSISKNETVGIKTQSASSPLFKDYVERIKTFTPPEWITLDKNTRVATIVGMPTRENSQFSYDLQRIVEFYSR